MKFSDVNKKDKTPPAEPAAKAPPEAPPPKQPDRPKPASKKISFFQIIAKQQAEPDPSGVEDMMAFLERQSEPPASSSPSRSSRPMPKKAPLQPKKSDSSVTASTLQAQRQQAQQVYGRAIQAMQEIITGIGTRELKLNDLLHEVLTGILKMIRGGNHALLALTTRSTASNYLYAHTVNTAILALYIGNDLEYEDSQLFILGAAALLHDIGMSQYMGLVQEQRTLTEAEEHEVRLHPVKSEEMMSHIGDIEKSAKELIIKISGQVHERISGKGYPKGLKGLTDIHVAAQIIGLCDMYEALSHFRSWRHPMTPHEAMKEILRNCTKDFDPRLIKSFMEQLSVFPPGSYVQLSSGDIGMVVKTHSRLLTRPVVEIKVQADGNRQDPPSLIDLVDNPMIHAARAVDETKLALKDKKLLLQFQAGRWWTE